MNDKEKKKTIKSHLNDVSYSGYCRVLRVKVAQKWEFLERLSSMGGIHFTFWVQRKEKILKKISFTCHAPQMENGVNQGINFSKISTF